MHEYNVCVGFWCEHVNSLWFGFAFNYENNSPHFILKCLVYDPIITTISLVTMVVLAQALLIVYHSHFLIARLKSFYIEDNVFGDNM
jgi:hypothetical protein